MFITHIEKILERLFLFIKYSSDSDDENIQSFAKNLCMHIAALKPEALDENSLDKKLLIRN